MSAPIGPGDWVECVDTRDSPVVVLHAIYLVEDTAWHRDIPCLILRGVVSPRGFRKVRADCFRPIYRPKSELIEQLKQPAPDAVRELISAD